MNILIYICEYGSLMTLRTDIIQLNILKEEAQGLYLNIDGFSDKSIKEFLDELNRIRDATMGLIWSYASVLGSENYEHLKDSRSLDYRDARSLLINILEEVIKEMDAYNAGLPPKAKIEKSVTIASNQKNINSKKVWVIHGRNRMLATDVFSFLRAIGLDPIEWTEARKLTGASSPYIGDISEAGFNYAQAFVVLLSGDDDAKLRDKFLKPNDPDYERNLTPQARPNVLFEAGMAFGRHPDRIVFVQYGDLRPFSDISGKHIPKLDNSSASRMEFANRLGDAGCDIPDLKSKSDWLTIGNFEPK